MSGIRSMPVLPVGDVARAVAFYRDRLGFAVGGVWPAEGEPGFAIVAFGTITVALDKTAPMASRREGWSAYLYVEDVDALHRRLVEAGVEIERAPEDAFYGCRDMDLRDPDGNLLAFGQDLQPGPEGPGL